MESTNALKSPHPASGDWHPRWPATIRALEAGTDRLRSPTWSGGFWGPAASRARSAGQLSPPPMSPEMARWNRWGRDVLREGDIVFRLGNARALRGIFALSCFIAGATDSPFSHTGIVAIEDGLPMFYDCSSDGIRLILIPICGVFLATVAVVLLTFEVGFRVEQYWRRR